MAAAVNRRDRPTEKSMDQPSKNPGGRDNSVYQKPDKAEIIDEVSPPPDSYAPRVLRNLHPVLQWIIYLGKRFLQVPPFLKALFYIALVPLCSSLSYIIDPLRMFYFFRKDSFLNQWFVKLSWGWTFWLLLAFFSLTAYVESDGRLHKIARGITRLLVGTFVWLFVTTSFMDIERRTGKCSTQGLVSEEQCVAAGSQWNYFDISGHAFLLIYCSLLILEESRAFFKWEKSDTIEQVRTGQADNVIKPWVLVVIRVLAVALALLALLWDWMLIVTLVFYHDFLQRTLGVALGILGWFLTYKVWYPRYWPGLPEDASKARA